MGRFWMAGLSAAMLAGAALPAMAVEKGYWAAIAEQVCTEITRAETFARAGNVTEAKSAVISAYFGTFEEKRMEIAERSNLGNAHTADIEELFNGLRKAVGKPGSGEVKALAETLRTALREDGKALDSAKVAPDGTGETK